MIPVWVPVVIGVLVALALLALVVIACFVVHDYQRNLTAYYEELKKH